jgi:surface antigen
MRRSRLPLITLVTCALLATAIAAFAAPPPWAPAHGWRKKNDAAYVGYSGRQWERDYGVVRGSCNREAIGAVLGGVAGGSIGNDVGGRDNRVVGTIVGAAVGALIGAKIGRELDERDRACVGQSLELAAVGETVRWSDQSLGVRYEVVPGKGFKRGEQNCRDVSIAVYKGKKRSREAAWACDRGGGVWELVARR